MTLTCAYSMRINVAWSQPKHLLFLLTLGKAALYTAVVTNLKAVKH